MNNQRGFALVEGLSSILFCIVALTGGLSVTYVSFARVWLKRAAYEASVCLSTPETTFNCEQDLRNSTAKALPIGRIDYLLCTRGRDQAFTRLRWKLNSSFELRIDDRRPIPLLGPSSIAKRGR